MSREWAHNTRGNGCGTRPGFNEIIPHFTWILMVCYLGVVFRDLLMYLSALLFQYSVSLMSTSMAFVWEDKTPESKRGRNTLIVYRLYLGKWFIRLFDCWRMSSARVDYIAPWWTYWLHQFPHVNLRFQPLDHTFKPQEENYQQVRPSVYTVTQRFMVQTVKISFVHRTVTLSLSLGLRVILQKYSNLITCFGSHVQFLSIPVYTLVSLNL